ncbi:hypothetical protein COY32_01510, partial [candidate division WWE3 bacterium CG_4_10_14_0_2_um_filter_41_14]
MSFLTVLVLIAFSNSLLGVLVLSRNYFNRTNRAFFLLIIFTNSWIICNYLAEYGGADLILWNRLTFTSVILLSATFSYFAYIFGRDLSSLSIIQKQFFITIPLVAVVLSVKSFIVAGLETRGESVDLIYGPGYSLFVLYFSIYIITGFYLLFKRFIHTEGVIHEQLKYLFAGMLTSIVFGVTTNLLYPILTGSHDLSKYGPFGVTFLIGSTTYAIVRHRLLDVRLAVRAGIYRLLLVIVFLFITTILISVATDFNLVSQNPSFPIITA